ncbi:hypothetical protein ACNF49_43275 [Actinomadura sp. ATCC 39365]
MVEAEPGETVITTVFLPDSAFQVWEDGWRTVEGEYTLQASHHVADPRLSITVKI